jgi:hypothetical protein
METSRIDTTTNGYFPSKSHGSSYKHQNANYYHIHNHSHISPIYPERTRDRLRRDLVGLSDIEYREIFNMIRQKVGQFSENKNGIFINLKYVDDELLDKIYDFLEFSKKNKMYLKELEEKQNIEKRSIDTSLHQQHSSILSRDNVSNHTTTQAHTEVYTASGTKKTTVDNFTFQNFIDKLTITNMKMFPENEKIVYPTIKQHKWNVSGVKSRLLKKCKDINKFNYDRFLNPYINPDEENAYMNTRQTNKSSGNLGDNDYDSDAELDVDNTQEQSDCDDDDDSSSSDSDEDLSDDDNDGNNDS